jgi:hypothetical protein
MKFSLSPPIDPKLKDAVRRLKHQYRQHAERVYVEFKEGHDGTIDFLALEEPLIKTRLQRQEQRARKRGPLGPLTLKESCVTAMNEEWLESKKEHVADMKFAERYYLSQTINLTKPKLRVKDRKASMSKVATRLSVEENANAQTIPLFEDDSLRMPVVEPQFTMVTPEDVDHAEKTRPKMPRPSRLGNGRGAYPLPPNKEWKWNNDLGYIVVAKEK